MRFLSHGYGCTMLPRHSSSSPLGRMNTKLCPSFLHSSISSIRERDRHGMVEFRHEALIIPYFNNHARNIEEEKSRSGHKTPGTIEVWERSDWLPTNRLFNNYSPKAK